MAEKQNTDKSSKESEFWVPWGGAVASGLDGGHPWMDSTRLQMFRFLSGLATCVLLFIVIRGTVVGGQFPWADLLNGLIFGILITLSFLRPEWLTLLMWLGLASLFANVVDGLLLWPDDVVGPPHMLFPLLVLYGALLGDISLSLIAMVGVLGVYAFSWIRHNELDRREILMISNLCIAALITGAAAFGVWLHHCRLLKRLDQQTKRLHNELETRLRIQAMVTHDIRNPLMTLVNAEILDDRQCIQAMAGRIAEIIKSTTELTTGSAITLSQVMLKDIWKYLLETFAANLADKGQKLVTRGDEKLIVETDITVLCNSVLGNFISNSIKFSPRGSTIELAAELSGDSVRIAVYDAGPGLPADLVQAVMAGRTYQSKPGTDGEPGTGYGLRIAALCAARINGRIEIKQNKNGGAVSIVLPGRG